MKTPIVLFFSVLVAAALIMQQFSQDTIVAFTDTQIAHFVDNDKDGYSSKIDCNDNDPTVNPGAREVKNGVDDDCDGVVDEGLP